MRTAFSTWHGLLFVALTASTIVILIVDFYGGQRLKDYVNEKLFGWWERVDKIWAPKIGQAEADFALRTTRTIFGRWPFSLKRLVTCGIVTAIFLLLAFSVDGIALIWECSRDLRCYSHFSQVEATYLGTVWFYAKSETVLLFALVWTSLAITECVLIIALRRFGALSNSTVEFLLTLFLSVILSVVLTHEIATVFSGVWEEGVTARYMDNLSNREKYAAALADFGHAVSKANGQLAGGSIIHWISMPRILVERDHPFTFILYQDYADDLPAVLIVVLFWYRAGIALGYFAWWLAGIGIKGIAITLARLFEYKKSPLTVFSAILAALAGFVHWVYQ